MKIVPISVVLAVLLGGIVGIIQYLGIPGLKQIILAYIIAMRGIPPLVLLFLIFFGTQFSQAIIAAIIALVIYHGAYAAEIIRGGLESIPKGQFEAAESVALRFDQTLLFAIIPQIWRSVLPSLVGQSILLVKDTALVSAIGVMEVLAKGRWAIQQVGHTMLVYFLIGLFYFLICFVLERIGSILERMLSKQFITQ